MASCKECGKTADELYGGSEWWDDLRDGMSPDKFAQDDGTYNWETDLFWCDDCYIKLGMPLGTA